jgi:hypothetical protein
MGYRERGGVWGHPERHAVFVGDFIDRGPSQVRVLEIVRAMCEAGTADAVMGNHEYNAVCYATPDPENPGEYLRPHTEKNYGQHAGFLNEVGAGSATHEEWIDWFRSLPLWLDEYGLRVVHACWHPGQQRRLAPWLDARNRLAPDGFVTSSRKAHAEHEAVEVLLKGLEVALPAGQAFHDKDGNERRDIRTRWWLNERVSYRRGALIDEELARSLPEDLIPADGIIGYSDTRPVFIGYYWLEGEPELLTNQVACTDYSIATGGRLCAYRWDGERELDDRRFVWVEMPYERLHSHRSVA